MTDTGLKASGTQTNTGAGHTGTNPTYGTLANVVSSNDVYFTISHGSGTNTSDYIHLTNFGFSVPSGATILGVDANIERKQGTSNRASDEVIQLVIGGVHGGTNKASVTKYPLADTVASYGGAADLWGNTILDTDVNASTFGIAIKTTNNANGTTIVSFDYVEMRVTYSSGDVTATVTGVAGTGSAGTMTAVGDANVTPTGVAGTGAVGDPTIVLLQTALPDGVAAEGDPGTATAIGDANVFPTGVAGTGGVGSPTIITDTTVLPTGVGATGQAGDVAVVIDVTAAPTGVAGTGQVGSPTIETDVTVAPTGVAGTGGVGSPTVEVDVTVVPDGVEATGQVGDVTIIADLDTGGHYGQLLTPTRHIVYTT